MTALGAAPTRSRLWAPLLSSIRATAMDCLQVNLALLCDREYGAGAHLALGAPLRFAVDRTGPVPGVQAALPDRLGQAAELLGLEVCRRWDGTDGRGLRELAAEHDTLYVVSDAFTLAWVPYAGHQHLEHSFLLTGSDAGWLVVDGYHNATEWGDIRPGVWRLDAADLDAAVPNCTALRMGPLGLPGIDTDLMLAGNAVAMAAALPAIESYLGEVRSRRAEPAVIEQLVLDVWLLARSRSFHAIWLAAVRPDSAGVRAAEEQATHWLELAAHSYVAGRRARRDGGLSERVLDRLADLLLGDVRLSRTLAVPAVQDILGQEIEAVLGIGVQPDTPLRDLANYSSFKLVDILERAEARLGLELDPDRLSSASLRDLGSMRELFLPDPGTGATS